MWYDINKTLSYNCLFNFVVGMRGVGKTYAFKKWAIKDFLKNGKEFIYVRRYKTELKAKNLKLFFSDVSQDFPGVAFDVKGTQFYINKTYAGQAIALSTAKINKSVPYPNVNKICFDEFIIDRGTYHYLQDEVINTLELYSTVARLRNDVKMFFLSNALTVTNPYFDYFNVKLPFGGKTVARTGDEILVEIIREAEFTKAAEQTRFGSIIAGTEYGNYAVANEFLRDNKNFVAKKTPGSDYYFTVRYCGKTYGIWIDYKEGFIFVSRDVDPSNRLLYALTADDHTPNAIYSAGGASRSPFLSMLAKMYRLGAVRFESVGIKNEFMPVFRLLRV